MSKVKQMNAGFAARLKGTVFGWFGGLADYLKTAPVVSVLAASLLVAVLAVGLSLNGSFGRLGQGLSSIMHASLEKTGFGLRDVTVQGRYNTGRGELRSVLQARIGESIFKIDLEATRERIESLPWVETAAVTRILPDVVHIEIREREAFALWKKGKKTALIDKSGTVIKTGNLKKYRTLPFVQGKQSELTAARLFDMLAAYPVIQSRMVGAERISDRRWTVFLDHGGSIHLPAENVRQALNLLMDMERDKRILGMQGRIIDLRLPDRVVLRARPLPLTSLFRKGNNT